MIDDSDNQSWEKKNIMQCGDKCPSVKVVNYFVQKKVRQSSEKVMCGLI